MCRVVIGIWGLIISIPTVIQYPIFPRAEGASKVYRGWIDFEAVRVPSDQ